MNAKCLGAVLAALLFLFGCDDNTGTLGIGMLPGSDGLSTSTRTFDVRTYSIPVDSVFAKTSTGYVGKFTDPLFGYYEASFLTELNCTDNFTFPDVYQFDASTQTASGSMAGDSVVSSELVIYYSSWFGDSLNACRMSVYELDQRLDKNRYTNIDPEKYYSPAGLLGRKAYSAYDVSVPDSVRTAKDSYGNDTFSPNVTFPLSKEFGERILRLSRTNPEYFANADAFIDNIFKGVYVKSDYGDGTVLYIDRVDLKMQFCFHYLDSAGVALKKTDGTDSLYYSKQTVFASTKEVIQANRFQNSELIAQRLEEKDHTYIKSPAGIFTEAVMPYDEISQSLTNDTLNAVKITFTNYRQDNKYTYAMDAPTVVLLLRKSEFKSFFEENSLPDNVTSFVAQHNSVAPNQYVFANVSRLVTTCVNEKQKAKEAAKAQKGTAWDEAAWEKEWSEQNPDWNKVLLIPVTPTYDYTNSTSPTLIAIQNDLKPGYAKLKGGPEGELLQIDVTYTSLNK